MIDLHSPSINKSAINYFKKCIKSGWVSTGGNYVTQFEKEIAKFTGAKFAIACNSGTSALHISLKLAGVSPGDEVIAPSLTFVASINAILYNCCSPIFMDSDDYFNIDVDKTIEFLNKNTFKKNDLTYNKKTKKKISAILVTHVWGHAADLRRLKKECDKKKIAIVEDASESLGTKYKKNNKHTGTIGLLGTLSFNANKIITTGSGGMILTNDSRIAKKAKYLTTQAKDNSIFFVHNNVGYNYRMSNISAALGISQIKQLKYFLKKKKMIRNFYEKHFKNLKNISLAESPSYSQNNNWLNLIRINKRFKLSRNQLIKKMIKNKISVRPVWKLNHLQKPFIKFQNFKIKNSLKLIKESLCLPSSPFLKKRDLKKIIKELNE